MLANNGAKLCQVMRAMGQTRNMSVIAGPPQVKISGAEKIVHFLLISAGMSVVPAWVLLNINNYKNKA